VPELPEVETFSRYFALHALGQRIERVEVRDERILTQRRDAFVRALRGRSFEAVRRHGKHLFASTEKRWLHLHFGMSGDLSYYEQGDDPRFARVIFAFDNGAKLAFEDMRLFGLAEVLDSPDAFIASAKLGPDPLDPKFTFPRFNALLEKRKGAIKSLLMTQEILAGMGNLYVDETLYATSIHPTRAVHKLRDSERKSIFTSMRKILRQAIARHAKGKDLPPTALMHHREEGERCPMCGGSIQRSVVFGRTTYFCARHQR
jgi:formamidopyrimidine-DNA glycosylase